MTDTPRLWFFMDALFTEQDAVERALARFGPGGPYALVVLLCEAYKRFFLKDVPGEIDMSYASLAQRAGLDDGDQARLVLAHYESAGVVQPLGCEFEGLFDECASFRLRFSKWGQWTPTSLSDPTNSARQAAHRAKSSTSNQSGDPSLKLGMTVTLDVEEEKDSKGKAGKGEREEVVRLSNLLAELIHHRDSRARTQPASKRWLDAIRLLLDRDGRTEAEIEHVIRWCQKDEFWRVVILSAPKLREKFDALYAKAGKPKGNADDFFKRNGM